MLYLTVYLEKIEQEVWLELGEEMRRAGSSLLVVNEYIVASYARDRYQAVWVREEP